MELRVCVCCLTEFCFSIFLNEFMVWLCLKILIHAPKAHNKNKNFHRAKLILVHSTYKWKTKTAEQIYGDRINRSVMNEVVIELNNNKFGLSDLVFARQIQSTANSMDFRSSHTNAAIRISDMIHWNDSQKIHRMWPNGIMIPWHAVYSPSPCHFKGEVMVELFHKITYSMNDCKGQTP